MRIAATHELARSLLDLGDMDKKVGILALASLLSLGALPRAYAGQAPGAGRMAAGSNASAVPGSHGSDSRRVVPASLWSKVTNRHAVRTAALSTRAVPSRGATAAKAAGRKRALNIAKKVAVAAIATSPTWGGAIAGYNGWGAQEMHLDATLQARVANAVFSAFFMGVGNSAVVAFIAHVMNEEDPRNSVWW